MALLDFFHSGEPSVHPPPPPEERICAVPLAAYRLNENGERSRETYIFYAFVFSETAEAAVARLHHELRDEGYEFIKVEGNVLVTSLSHWTAFVNHWMEWMRNDLPTAQQLADLNRGVIHYSPKMIKL